MRSTLLLAMLGLVFAPMAWAQPATKNDSRIETVIVTVPKYHFGVTPNAIAHDFVGYFATPTVLLGTIPRWHAGICPETRGLPPQIAEAVNQRLRKIAAQVGAPMKEAGCKPNLSITFTPEPQTLLDNIRKENSLALGYHGATTVSHPVQAWYETGIRDIDGRTELDREPIGSTTFDDECHGSKGALPCWRAPTSKIEGLAGRTGLNSDLLAVFIIVDTSKTGSYNVASVADYIAMLALSRTEDYDDCQMMPSITNLLSYNCADKMKPDLVTASDIAYLRGVYRMESGAPLIVQQDQIAGEMANALAGGK